MKKLERAMKYMEKSLELMGEVLAKLENNIVLPVKKKRRKKRKQHD